jgi:hypothetical protein
MIYLVKMYIICSEFSAESMQGYDTSLIHLNWMQVHFLYKIFLLKSIYFPSWDISRRKMLSKK